MKSLISLALVLLLASCDKNVIDKSGNTYENNLSNFNIHLKIINNSTITLDNIVSNFEEFGTLNPSETSLQKGLSIINSFAEITATVNGVTVSNTSTNPKVTFEKGEYSLIVSNVNINLGKIDAILVRTD